MEIHLPSVLTRFFRYSRQLFTAVILASTLGITPILANAATFMPLADTDISVMGDTQFNFDLYSIVTGITVNYLAAPNTMIDIITEGDIILDGILNANDLSLAKP